MKQSSAKDGTSPPVTRFEDDVHFSARLSLRHADILISALKDESMLLHAKAAREPENSDAEQDLRRQANQRDAEADAIRDTMHKARLAGDVHTTRNDGCAVDQRHASGNSSIVQMESNKLLPWLMIMAMFSAVAMVIAIGAGMCAWWASKEFKQVQVQLMYTNAIMLREGLVQPGDMVYGPEGNLEYKQHELKRK